MTEKREEVRVGADHKRDETRRSAMFRRTTLRLVHTLSAVLARAADVPGNDQVRTAWTCWSVPSRRDCAVSG